MGEMKWYVLRTAGTKEKKAAEYLTKEIERSGLQDEVAQVLVPVKKEIVTKNGKRKAVDRLLFPGYVLIQAELSAKLENIIRNGSAGSYTDKAKLFDVVLATGAYSESSFALTQSGDTDDLQLPSAELNDALRASAAAQGIPLIEGNIHSSDVFYRQPSDAKPAYWERLRDEKGCLAVEMESFALFHNAKVLGKRAACLLTLLWQMRETGARPRFETYFTLTVHEEVGHGGATLPAVDELLAVDMGCIGEDLSCTEYQVSICAKDGGGPYDYGMVSRLVKLAKEHKVDYAVDIYPHYGSDVGAAWRSGMDCRAALIGPGVHASHGMERTHLDGLCAAMDLAAFYLELG